MINPKISVDLCTTKSIAPFSCTPREQEVHTKSEIVHPTPGQLGLRVILGVTSPTSRLKALITDRKYNTKRVTTMCVHVHGFTVCQGCVVTTPLPPSEQANGRQIPLRRLDMLS